MKLGVKHNPWKDYSIYFSWPFFGHFFYLLGSVLWVAYPSLCWKCEDSEDCEYLLCSMVEFGASFSFVLNGFCSLFEVWSLDNYYRSVGGYPHIFGGGYKKTSFGLNYQKLNWFLIIHLTFFYGALCDCMASLMDIFVNGEYPIEYFIDGAVFLFLMDIFVNGEYFIASTVVDLTSAFLWSISGVTSLAYCCYDRYSREKYGATLQYSVLGFFSRKNKNAWLDLFLLSHVFFFFGTVCYVAGAVTCFLWSEGWRCWAFETAGGIFFIGEWVLNLLDFLREMNNEDVLELDEQECVNKILLESNLISIEYLNVSTTDKEADRHESTLEDGMREVEPSYSVTHTEGEFFKKGRLVVTMDDDSRTKETMTDDDHTSGSDYYAAFKNSIQ